MTNNTRCHRYSPLECNVIVFFPVEVTDHLCRSVPSRSVRAWSCLQDHLKESCSLRLRCSLKQGVKSVQPLFLQRCGGGWGLFNLTVRFPRIQQAHKLFGSSGESV